MSAAETVEPIETVLVKTKNGPVRGRKRTGWPEYISFQGIPFAKPPVGELRFKVGIQLANVVTTVSHLVCMVYKYSLHGEWKLNVLLIYYHTTVQYSVRYNIRDTLPFYNQNY